MKNMTCDNDCTEANWTEALISIGTYDDELHVSHDRDADTEGTFLAFCHDSQEMLKINGWHISEYEEISGQSIYGIKSITL